MVLKLESDVGCSSARFYFPSVFQEWSEDESDEDNSQQPISREDSGIQLDRTPQEDQDNSNKTVPVTWTGGNVSFMYRLKFLVKWD